MKRRDFIKHISSASLVMLGGNVINLTAADAADLRKNTLLRFVVASDGHYGQQGTESDSFYETLVKHVSEFNATSKLDFCVINGDIIHDGKDLLVTAKKHLDKLPAKYYVTKGNHDRVSDQYWNEVWGIPVNHEVRLKENTLLLATTSNEEGDYLSPDLDWMKSKLESNKKQKNIFIFIHIPQAKWTKNGIETPAFFEMLKSYKNAVARWGPACTRAIPIAICSSSSSTDEGLAPPRPTIPSRRAAVDRKDTVRDRSAARRRAHRRKRPAP